jgi:hypothetical protein
MATKRRTPAKRRTTAKRTPARRRTTTAAKPRRRRRTARKKSMLSELFNPKMAQAGGKAILSGAVGGAGGAFIEKLMKDADNNKKLITMGAASFVTATVFKMPNVGAGMAGVAIYKAMEGAGMLAEDDNMYLQQNNYANPIERLPMVLNENNDAMYLQEDDNMYLQESIYGVGYPSSAEFWQ